MLVVSPAAHQVARSRALLLRACHLVQRMHCLMGNCTLHCCLAAPVFVQDILFYGLPDHAHSYSELVANAVPLASAACRYWLLSCRTSCSMVCLSTRTCANLLSLASAALLLLSVVLQDILFYGLPDHALLLRACH
jgi:hypothetical protein